MRARLYVPGAQTMAKHKNLNFLAIILEGRLVTAMISVKKSTVDVP
jgi:hypothetical protein